MQSACDTAEKKPLGTLSYDIPASYATLLNMNGIEKRYGSNVALNQVEFELRAGEIHALLGENGAGKSTLMQILTGLIKPDSGQISLDGTVIKIDSPRRARTYGIAMVHQHFTLVPAFTVSENLALDQNREPFLLHNPLKGLRFDHRSASKSSLEYAKSLGWELDPNARISDLPVGAQQRVEIVKALSTNANILIFDEPTAVLAGKEVEELFAVFRKLRAAGKSVILIAHKLSEVLAVADRVTVLRRGAKVATEIIADANAETLAEMMVGKDIRLSVDSKKVSLNARAPLTEISCFSCKDLVVLGDRGARAIDSVSFEVRPNEIFGIGGVDGNGQSELAETLVGLRTPVSGILRWKAGDFLPGDSPSYGYIPQDRRRSGLAVTMSIEDNLLFAAVQKSDFQKGHLLNSRELKKLAARLVKEFDIRTEDTSLPVSSLSGGNQQKIVVARAFYANPEWIVAVNPTRGLDIVSTQFVHERLKEAKNRGASILLISTDWDEVAELSDRAAILSSGRLTPYKIGKGGSKELGLALGGARKTGEACV